MEKIFWKDIKEYCQEKKEEMRKVIGQMECPPRLAVIQVGSNEASNRYVKNKGRDCDEVGIVFDRYFFEENVGEEEFLREIAYLQDFYDGLIGQLPLPGHIRFEKVKMVIRPEKDVDGFHPMSCFKPCTPKGIIDYCRNGCGYTFEGKTVVIFGRSEIVGRPLAKMLTDEDATVILCHSKSKDKWHFINIADMVVSAVGKAGFLNCYSIEVPVVDVGINFDENGKLVGDCINVEDRDVTPVPGGVGLLTRLALLENVMEAANGRSEDF